MIKIVKLVGSLPWLAPSSLFLVGYRLRPSVVFALEGRGRSGFFAAVVNAITAALSIKQYIATLLFLFVRTDFCSIYS